MKRKIMTIIMALILALIIPLNTFAKGTYDAVEPVDESKPCSLTLTYIADGLKCEGLEIEAFCIADYHADFSFTLHGDFSSYPVTVNGIRSQSEWADILTTMKAYIVADKISADQTRYTDSEGQVKFTDLYPGIYLIRWTKNQTKDKVSGFEPFLIVLPELTDDGTWNYDVTALPKPGEIPPEPIPYKVMKLWDDEGASGDRPHSVEVEIYKNGELYETVTLEASNRWSFSWETLDTADWEVVERNVPQKYKMTLSRNGNTFIVTNSRESEPIIPPEFGESSEIYIYIGVALAAGILLILLSVKRRKTEK